MKVIGGLAQLARAPALHAGGQRFESVILHNSKLKSREEVKDAITNEYLRTAEVWTLEFKWRYKVP